MNTESLIEAIRAAVAEGASDEVRAGGVHACRALIAVLEAPPGEPAAPVPPAPPAPSINIAAIASAIRGVPPGQLADLLIAKLRTLVPADAQGPTAVRQFNIPLVKVPTP